MAEPQEEHNGDIEMGVVAHPPPLIPLPANADEIKRQMEDLAKRMSDIKKEELDLEKTADGIIFSSFILLVGFVATAYTLANLSGEAENFFKWQSLLVLAVWAIFLYVWSIFRIRRVGSYAKIAARNFQESSSLFDAYRRSLIVLEEGGGLGEEINYVLKNVKTMKKWVPLRNRMWWFYFKFTLASLIHATAYVLTIVQHHHHDSSK